MPPPGRAQPDDVAPYHWTLTAPERPGHADVMIAVLLVSGIYAAALWLLVQRWNQGRGSGQFVLAVFPICLLFIAAPVPFGVGALIQAFRGIAEEGTGGLPAVAPFCVGILAGLRNGTLACLAGLSVAAAVQAFATGDGPSAPPQTGPGTWWRVLVLAASPVLMGPVLFLGHVARGIVGMVMKAGSMNADPGELGAISATVSHNVVLSVALGMVSILLLCGSAIATVIAARSAASQHRLTVYSWAAVAVVVGWGVWFVVQVSGDITAFRAAVR